MISTKGRQEDSRLFLTTLDALVDDISPSIAYSFGFTDITWLAWRSSLTYLMIVKIKDDSYRY